MTGLHEQAYETNSVPDAGLCRDRTESIPLIKEPALPVMPAQGRGPAVLTGKADRAYGSLTNRIVARKMTHPMGKHCLRNLHSSAAAAWVFCTLVRLPT